jgi:drug/metabolite transporter (DMT)-like permease
MMTTMRDLTRSRWWMPSFCLFLGAVMLAAFAIGGNAGDGLACFGVMAVVGAAFLLGRRSETLQGIGGPGRDERWAMIDVHATALSGVVVILAIIGGWLYEVANGQDGNPFTWLAAVGGVAYIVAVAVLRRRS